MLDSNTYFCTFSGKQTWALNQSLKALAIKLQGILQVLIFCKTTGKNIFPDLNYVFHEVNKVYTTTETPKAQMARFLPKKATALLTALTDPSQLVLTHF